MELTKIKIYVFSQIFAKQQNIRIQTSLRPNELFKHNFTLSKCLKHRS